MTESAGSAVLLASPVRRRILEVLGSADKREAEGLTAAQLATHLSLHATTARFHLDQLVAAGLVEATFHNSPGAGRPRKLYARVAQPQPPVSAEESLLLLTGLLTKAFAAQSEGDDSISPDEAGTLWAEEHVPAYREAPATTPGQWIAKLGQVVDVLSAWGYTPELAIAGGGRDARIELTHCPFRELARQNPDVVCGVHRGLIAGTLGQLGEPGTRVDLHPFAIGDRCIAHLQSGLVPHPPSADPPTPGTT